MPRDKARGFIAGEAKTHRELIKELAIPQAQKVQKKARKGDVGADDLCLPPPLYPPLALPPFAFHDPDGSQKWLEHKARELVQRVVASPCNLDAPAGGAGGPARLLAHVDAIRHLDALPLELMLSRRKGAEKCGPAAPGRGSSAAARRIGGAGAAEQFARAAKRAAAAAANAAGGGGGGGEEGEEEEGGEAAEEEEEEEDDEDEEDFNDYLEDFQDDGSEEDEGAGGGGDWD
jgi:hypothetical protein